MAKALNYYRKIHERYYNKDKILFIVDGIDENIKCDGRYLLDLIPDNSMLDEGVFILLTCRTNEEIISNKELINKLDKIKFLDKESFYRTDNYEYKNILKNTSVDYPFVGSITFSVNGFFSILRILKLVIHR